MLLQFVIGAPVITLEDNLGQVSNEDEQYISINFVFFFDKWQVKILHDYTLSTQGNSLALLFLDPI